ncbi:hypothetical protein ES703_30969 [subsurface metagenome]
MDKEETKLTVAALLELSDIADRLDALHKYLTDFLLQKGAPHVKDPDDSDYRGN